MIRRQFLSGIGATLGVGGMMLALPRTGTAATLALTEQIDWIASNRILGEVVAQGLGFFAEEGIDLKIVLGGPNNTGIASVASGSAGVGLLSSSPAIMAARSGNIPIKCIAAGFQQHPLTFYSLPRRPIRTAADFRGKRIGTTRPGFNLVQALLRKNGIPESEVRLVALGGEVGPLLDGQVDAITSWATDATKLKPLGPDRVEPSLWDTGVKLYANPFYATDTALKERPDLLAAFIAATARGWAYVKDNPEKAIDIYIKAYPMRDRDAEMEAVGMATSYVFNKETAQLGWGLMKPEIWAEQIRLFQEIGQFERQTVPKVEDVMTLSVLEATVAKRPKIG